MVIGKLITDLYHLLLILLAPLVVVLNMARELYCPECNTEYWGETKGAVCNECNHIFTSYDITKALGYIKDNNVNTQSRKT